MAGTIGCYKKIMQRVWWVHFADMIKIILINTVQRSNSKVKLCFLISFLVSIVKSADTLILCWHTATSLPRMIYKWQSQLVGWLLYRKAHWKTKKMASTSTKGEINAESVSCHQEFIRTSLESKRQPYTRTHVTARASGRNLKPLFHFLLPPQAALADCRLSLIAWPVPHMACHYSLMQPIFPPHVS